MVLLEKARQRIADLDAKQADSLAPFKNRVKEIKKSFDAIVAKVKQGGDLDITEKIDTLIKKARALSTQKITPRIDIGGPGQIVSAFGGAAARRIAGGKIESLQTVTNRLLGSIDSTLKAGQVGRAG